MHSEDNQFNDTTRPAQSQGNAHSGDTVNKGSEPAKEEKSNTPKMGRKEQMGKVIETMKPYAAKAWAVTQDLAGLVKDKAPHIIEALKKGFQESKTTVQNAYDKFQKQREEKAATSTTPASTKSTNNASSDSAKDNQIHTGSSGINTDPTPKTDPTLKQHPADTSNKPKR